MESEGIVVSHVTNINNLIITKTLKNPKQPLTIPTPNPNHPNLGPPNVEPNSHLNPHKNPQSDPPIIPNNPKSLTNNQQTNIPIKEWNKYIKHINTE